jgi:hypothetical protein
MIMLKSRMVHSGALSLLALTILAPQAARAEDIFKMMGINIGIENQIDYHERSPLVVPPDRKLPPPQPPGSAKAPNWPVDADLARNKEIEKRRKLDQTFDYDQFTRTLPPSQIGPAGGATPSPPTSTGSAGSGGDMTATMRPSELGSSGGFFSFFKGGSDQKTAVFAGEKPRRSLTEPPVGYQVPSPSQPYGVTPPAPDYANTKKAADVPAGGEGP